MIPVPSYVARRSARPHLRGDAATLDLYRSNLRSVLGAASPGQWRRGLEWYPLAHVACCDLAARHGVSLSVACGVVSALSPGMDWAFNVPAADYLLGAVRAGTVPAEFDGARFRSRSSWRSTVFKAARIADAPEHGYLDVLDFFVERSAPKTRAFYLNLFDPSNPLPVTVDGHMANAARHGLDRHGVTSAGSIGAIEYDLVAQAISDLASEWSSANGGTVRAPCQIQAVLWVVYREL